MAQATEEGLPIDIQSVTVDVKSPGNKQVISIKLSRSNEKEKTTDAMYVGKFYNTASQGTYQFTFNTILKNGKGESTTREELRFLPLTYNFSTENNFGVMEEDGGNVWMQPWPLTIGLIIFGGIIGLLIGRKKLISTSSSPKK